MGGKRIYILSICYIAAYSLVVNFTYPELDVTALVTLIAIFGFASALVTNYLLLKVKNDKGDSDE